MGLILTLSGLICTIAAAVVSRLLADEAKAWMPRQIEWLVEAAVRRLPIAERDRYWSEWWGHIEQLPGDISKLATAAGYVLAAGRMHAMLVPRSRRVRVQRAADITLGVALVSASLPLLVMIAAAIRMENNGPILIRQKMGRNVQPILLFRTRRKCPGKKMVVVTAVGQLLERSELRTLPFLFDVIGGRATFFIRRK